MKVYIAIKYDKDRFALALRIKEIVSLLGHTPYCFATDEKDIYDEKKMMAMALEKIAGSEVVILESSNPSFGVGIEAGYAFSKNKKLIGIIRESEKISGTLKGICNYYLTYSDFEDLSSKLKEVL